MALLAHIWESGDSVEDVDIKKIQSIPWSFQKLIARREEPTLLEIDKCVCYLSFCMRYETEPVPGIILNLSRKPVIKWQDIRRVP